MPAHHPQTAADSFPSDPRSQRRTRALEVLQHDIEGCRSCTSLPPWRKFDRAASGTLETGYLLVGEAPGFVSWQNRRRFTGPAGLLIRRALRRVGHPRFRDLEDLFYLTDAVKCHPAAFHNDRANRSPSGREVRACVGFLARELQVLRPRVIVTFGNRAAASVAQALASRDHGGATAWGRCPELVAFPHPSPRNIVTIRS
ncbi:MAG: uracil-DNA glycosylase family protein, partial [Nitrospirales bacterium]